MGKFLKYPKLLTELLAKSQKIVKNCTFSTMQIKKQPHAELLNFGDLTLGHEFYYHRKNTELFVSLTTF